MTRCLAQGAEAELFLDSDCIRKVRVHKGYRHPHLDIKLRTHRTRREAKILDILQKAGVRTPRLLRVDEEHTTLVMEFVQGVVLRDCIKTHPATFGRCVGELIGATHVAGVMHGDVTTANMIHTSRGLVLIDFGLARCSNKDEDFAVDVHVFEQTTVATHTACAADIMSAFFKGYERTNPRSERVFSRLESLQKRGRHKAK